MNFSEKIKKIRKESGISQEMLADALEVSRQAVGKWESGQGYPEIEKLIIISDMFDVSLDYLLKDTTDQYDSKKKYIGDQTQITEDEYKVFSIEHVAENTNDKINSEDEKYFADAEIVEDYLAYKKSEGHKIGAGVATIISSISFVIGMGGVTGVSLLLAGIAIGVAILVAQDFVPKHHCDEDENYDILDTTFLNQYQLSHRLTTQKYGKFIAGGILLIFTGVIAVISGFLPVSFVFWGLSTHLFILANYTLEASNNVVNNFKNSEDELPELPKGFSMKDSKRKQ